MKSLKGDAQLAIGVVVLAAVYLYMDMRLPEVRLSDPIGPQPDDPSTNPYNQPPPSGG